MTEPAPVPIFGIILAGGLGTRFWPLSRSQYPKQVLRLLSSQSMLQSTVERLLPRIPLERLAIVTGAGQVEAIRLELYRQGWQDIRLWLEPQGRNTAAAAGLAAALLDQEADDCLMAIFPADHFIRDRDSLLQALDRGAAWAQKGFLVTLGIPPTRPETGFGYIKQGPALDEAGLAFRAARFVEKPGLAQAETFLQEGGYFWNSGIFICRRDILFEAFARHLPELHRQLARLRDREAGASLAEIYLSIPSVSLDHGILEQADNVAMVPVEMGWHDVGSWAALPDLFPRDESGNVILGRALDRGSRDSVIFSQNRLVATIGLDKIIVIDTPDATLVCHRERVQEVKDLVGELHRRQMAESVQHATVERPWGRYTVMDEGQGYKVKQIVVEPGKKLSLQLHQHRAEHWVVVAGSARVTIGRETSRVEANQSVYIPAKTAHRLENPETEPLRIIEVQTGSYLEEDDILRLEDDFWRK